MTASAHTRGERFRVRLLNSQELSPSVVQLRFGVLDDATFQWVAGQYAELSSGEDSVGQPYSIASAPDPEAPGEFEMALSRSGNSELLTSLTPGSVALVSEARGGLNWLPNASASLLVGIGTGLAPLRAMLQARRAAPTRGPCTLLFGAKTPADLLWREEFERYAREDALFRFEPTLSQADASWAGRRGRVQRHLLELGRSLGSPNAYLCGKKAMVTECVEQLVSELGVGHTHILSEGY